MPGGRTWGGWPDTYFKRTGPKAVGVVPRGDVVDVVDVAPVLPPDEGSGRGARRAHGAERAGLWGPFWV